MFTPTAANTSEHFQEIDTVIKEVLELTDKDTTTEGREAAIDSIRSALTPQHYQELRTNLLNSSIEDLAAYRAQSDDYKNFLVLLLDKTDRKTFAEKLKPTEAEQQLQAQQAAEEQRRQEAAQQALIARLEALRAEEQRKQQEAEELQRQQRAEEQRQLLIIAQELAARQAAEQQRAQDEARRQAAHAEVARIGL